MLNETFSVIFKHRAYIRHSWLFPTKCRSHQHRQRVVSHPKCGRKWSKYKYIANIKLVSLFCCCQNRKPPPPRVSRSQGSTPSKILSTTFTLSPMHGNKRKSPTASRKKKRSTIQRANSTIERILQYQELGKDVPMDIAIKRVLILAQRGDWPGCEQALRAVEKADHAEEQQPLANLVDPASGNTPLMYAAMENKISLMERMIALGCSLKRENSVSRLLFFVYFYSFWRQKVV